MPYTDSGEKVPAKRRASFTAKEVDFRIACSDPVKHLQCQVDHIAREPWLTGARSYTIRGLEHARCKMNYTGILVSMFDVGAMAKGLQLVREPKTVRPQRKSSLYRTERALNSLVNAHSKILS